jgi:hypothetical protein
MSLLGLLGRGFQTPQTAASIAVPTLSVSDKKDGTGATATIAGATAGSTNTVRTAKLNELTFTDQGSRSGDGTVALSLTDTGQYLALVVTALGDIVDVSELVAFYVTSGVDHPFQAHRRRILRRRVLSLDLFAEVVTYKIPQRPDLTPSVLADHKDEIVMDGEGEVLVETLSVVIDREAIPCAPTRGHKLRRDGEDRDYLFSYAGRHDSEAYRVKFERRRRISERLG